MTRLTSQRGVSLMLLIIAVTVFAAIAIGTVTLLRSRHESYPYQVQSYQALALADAGVQFATRYAVDNWVDFSSYPATYIGPTYDPNKRYTFGSGYFQLRYEPATTCTPGQMGTLYCKGVIGTATREVKITDFGGMIGKISGNALLSNPQLVPWQERRPSDWDTTVPGVMFSGWRVAMMWCGVSQYGQGNIWIPCDGPGYNPVKVAVSYPAGYDYVANPLYLARLAISEFDSRAGSTRFAWDEVCARSSMGWPPAYITIPNWDGVTMPPPAGQYVQPQWNVMWPGGYYGGTYYGYPDGDRTMSSVYCTGVTWPAYPPTGTLWNSDKGPVGLDFTLNEPPVGTKFYVEFPTIVSDPDTHVWTTYTNRYVFTATKNY